MSKKRRPEIGVALFPFLAVLICTMGALIVVLVLFMQQAKFDAHQTAAREAATPRADPLAAERQVAQDKVDDAKWRQNILEQQRQQQVTELSDVRTKADHLDDHIRRLRDQARALVGRAQEIDQAKTGESQELSIGQAELAKLKAEIERRKKELGDKKKAAAKDGSYALIPYTGPNGTKRRPIYIECRVEGVVLHPEGLVLGPQDFNGPMAPGNPLDAAIRCLADVLKRSGEPGEPYPLLVVRPSGIVAYQAARSALQGWDDEFGYELVSEDKNLEFGKPTPGMQRVLEEVVGKARDRQVMLAAAMPRKFQADETLVSFAPEDQQSYVAAVDAARGSGGARNGNGENTVEATRSTRGSGLPGGTGTPGTGMPGGTGGQAGFIRTSGGTGTGMPGVSSAFAGGGNGGQPGFPGGISGGTGNMPGGTGGNGYAGGTGQGSGGTGQGQSAAGGTGAARGSINSSGNYVAGNGGGGAAGNGGGPYGGPYPGGNGGGSNPGNGGGSNPGNGGSGGSGGSGGTGTGNGSGNGRSYVAGNGSGQSGGQAGGQPGGAGQGSAGSGASGGSAQYAGGVVGGTNQFGSRQPGGGGGGVASGMPSGNMSNGGDPNALGANYPNSPPNGTQVDLSNGVPNASGNAAQGSSKPTKDQPPKRPPAPGRSVSNWGLSGANGRTTAVTRPVRVICLPDRLVIVPEKGDDRQPIIIPVSPELQPAEAEAFVKGIQKQQDSWGAAMTNGYWKPVLQIEVSRAAEPHFDALQQLLQGSGFELQRKAAQ